MECIFAVSVRDGLYRAACQRCGRVVQTRTLPVKAWCRSATQKQTSRPYRIESFIPSGPGTELKRLLSYLGIYAVPENCSCNARAAIMDAWGCDECERRIDEIVGWLREEAGKRGLPFIDIAGRMLVRRAIRNARKAAAADA